MRIGIKATSFALMVFMIFPSLSGCVFPLKEQTKTTYTLNEYILEEVTNISPHARTSEADMYIPTYTEMGFVDVTAAEGRNGYTWSFEMATAIDDITASFADKESWGITEESGRVYKITLNPHAVWENGERITADTYLYSMQAILDPHMQNSGAAKFTDSSAAILYADRYFASDLPVYAPVTSESEAETSLYMHLTSRAMAISSEYSVKDLYEIGYIDKTSYKILAENANGLGYIELTDDTREAAEKVAADFLAAFGLQYTEDLFKKMLFYDTGTKSETYDFADVGLQKSGEYELIYITAQPTDMFTFLTAMRENFLICEKLFEGGKRSDGDLTVTDYGTCADTYMSYGPYKLVSMDDSKIVMEKNDMWYGYSDGAHDGQYMTTHIRCDIIPDHDTALSLFTEGELDRIALTEADLSQYGRSDCLYKAAATYLYRFVFATDLEKLAALETVEGENKKVLAYDDFRRAISLAIDRKTLTEQTMPGYKPVYYLFSDLYYADAANDPSSLYRQTATAKEAMLSLYGITCAEENMDTAYEALTGYDLDDAKALFQTVYEQAIADGNYADGERVVINCMVSSVAELTENERKQEALLNQLVTKATVGTGFEGKIQFIYMCGAQNRHADVAAGRIEMISSAWGHDAPLDPYSLIRAYTDPAYMAPTHTVYESCGWDPTDETLTLTVDTDGDGTAEEITHTLCDWAHLLSEDLLSEDGSTVAFKITASATRLTVLAALENAVLASYQCIPYAMETQCSLYSKQISDPTVRYDCLYGYGGVRYLTYQYDDASWDEYILRAGGILSYE